MAPRIPENEARRVAVKAGVDPRSVKRLCDGKKLLPMNHARVVAALRDLGLASYLPPDMAPARRR